MQDLINLLELPESLVFDHTIKRIAQTGYKTNGDDYLYYDNNSPIVLIAHIDTVKRKACKVKVDGNVLTNGMNDPLGGDDRCGVYAMIKVVEQLRKSGIPLPSLLFTNHEEVGGVGMKNFLKANVFNKEGVRLLIALDRKGCNDWVDYIAVPKEVKRYIETFGFIEGNGSYSDVMDLSRETLIPGINLSVGYYSQHTASERVHFDELELTIRRVISIVKKPIDQLYKIEPKQDRYDDSWGWGHSRYYNYTSPYKWADKTYGKPKSLSSARWCDYCGNVISADSAWDDAMDMCMNCSNQLADSPTKEMIQDDQIFDYVQEVINANTTEYDHCLVCGDTWWLCECGAMLNAFDAAADKLMTDNDMEDFYHELLDYLDLDTPFYNAIESRANKTIVLTDEETLV